MQSIIDKYKGQSSQGYIFPFAINESDLYNKDFYKWNNKKDHVLVKINHFLKKVAPFIGVSPNDLIVYTFRHTVLTHEIQDNKKSPMRIAKEAGTSVIMLEKHYYDYLA
jgi:hypothetical protein